MILNIFFIILALAMYGSEAVYAFPPQIYNQNYKPHSYKHNSIYYYTSSKPVPGPTNEDEATISPIQSDHRVGDHFSYRSIQYAPLISKSEDQLLNKEKYKDMELTVTEINLPHLITDRSNIEPRLEVNQKSVSESRTTIVHGHNIHVPKVVYANPLIYNYGTKYQTEQTAKVVDNVALGNRKLLTKPTISEHLYPVLSKKYKNSESFSNGRVLHEKESPLIQPQLIHARPYRLHLNTARAYNSVHAPLKSMLINKILPPCKNFDNIETRLDVPSSKQTKLYAVHSKCIHRRS